MRQLMTTRRALHRRYGHTRGPGDLIPTPYRLVGGQIMFGPSKGGQQIGIQIGETGAGDAIYQLVQLWSGGGVSSLPPEALSRASGVHGRKGSHYYTTFQEARADLARLAGGS